MFEANPSFESGLIVFLSVGGGPVAFLVSDVTAVKDNGPAENTTDVYLRGAAFPLQIAAPANEVFERICEVAAARDRVTAEQQRQNVETYAQQVMTAAGNRARGEWTPGWDDKVRH
jgi:hypothetical protein